MSLDWDPAVSAPPISVVRDWYGRGITRVPMYRKRPLPITLAAISLRRLSNIACIAIVSL